MGKQQIPQRMLLSGAILATLDTPLAARANHIDFTGVGAVRRVTTPMRSAWMRQVSRWLATIGFSPTGSACPDA